jgi:hypothetical protein
MMPQDYDGLKAWREDAGLQTSQKLGGWAGRLAHVGGSPERTPLDVELMQSDYDESRARDCHADQEQTEQCGDLSMMILVYLLSTERDAIVEPTNDCTRDTTHCGCFRDFD